MSESQESPQVSTETSVAEERPENNGGKEKASVGTEKFIWPDPSVLEKEIRQKATLVQGLNKDKPPSYIAMSEGTYRSIVMGPAAPLWQPLVTSGPTKNGQRNFIMGIELKLVANVPARTMMYRWEDPKLAVAGNYTWGEADPTTIALFTVTLAKQYQDVMETVRVGPLKMQGLPSSGPNVTQTELGPVDNTHPHPEEIALEELAKWSEALRLEKIYQQRLIVLNRMMQTILRRKAAIDAANAVAEKSSQNTQQEKSETDSSSDRDA